MYLWRLRTLMNSSECSWSTCLLLVLKFLRNFAKKKYSNPSCARTLGLPITCSLSALDSSLCHHPISAYPSEVCIYVLSHYNCSFLPEKYKILQLKDNGFCWLPGEKKQAKNNSFKMLHILFMCSELSPWEGYPLTTERAY